LQPRPFCCAVVYSLFVSLVLVDSLFAPDSFSFDGFLALLGFEVEDLARLSVT